MVNQTLDVKDPTKPFLILALLWCVGWTLRVPILSAPPLATQIADSFHLGEASIGALTMLPVMAIALASIPAAWVITQLGLKKAIVLGLLVMTIASVLRGQVPNSFLLLLASAIMGFGVALFQNALPLATRAWTPSHIALASAVYLNGMMVGELSGAGLTLPIIMPMAGEDWRLALVIWAVPILAITLWVSMTRFPNDREQSDQDIAHDPALPRWNDRTVWKYGLILGHTVVAFFIVNAYSASLLLERGEESGAGFFHFAYNATPLLASLVILLKPNWIGFERPVLIFALCSTAGLLGFIIFEGPFSWFSAVVTGLTSTIQLILLLSLPPIVAKGKAVIRLSAGMTLISFTMAFLLTVLGGYLAGLYDSFVLALIPALVYMLLSLMLMKGRHRFSPYQ